MNLKVEAEPPLLEPKPQTAEPQGLPKVRVDILYVWESGSRAEPSHKKHSSLQKKLFSTPPPPPPPPTSSVRGLRFWSFLAVSNPKP